MELKLLLKALKFAAEKHRDQRRKDKKTSPYINHPIEVASILVSVGGVADTTILVAALLHDTIEDTKTSGQEIEEHFGHDVRRLVEEMTDDKDKSKAERKRLQIEKAPLVSPATKLIKLADKICNVQDVISAPPVSWSLERRREYLDWAEKVVAGLRGSNQQLELRFDTLLREGRIRLSVDS